MTAPDKQTIVQILTMSLLSACASPGGGGGGGYGAVPDAASTSSLDATWGDTPTATEVPLDAPDTTADPGSPASVCGAAACGGDLVGEWSYSTVCRDEPVMFPTGSAACKGAKLGSAMWREGTLEFGSDGQVKVWNRLVEESQSWLPSKCSGTQCQMMHGFDSCEVAGEGCRCVAATDPPYDTSSEPYQQIGVDQLEIGSGADAAHFEYCVSKGVLVLIHPEDGSATYLERP
jgi:hypothetical protein